MRNRKVRWLKAISGAMVLCLALSVCGLYGQCAGIRDSVVRLHILANSDSDEDQALKLRVRDAVTQAAAGWLDGAGDAQEALAMAQAYLPRLRETAEKTVREAGYDYPVSAEICRMYFTTRQYDTVTLPAGMYDAVRFTIGEGKGHNWWCVVFPPMCIGSATEKDTIGRVLNDRQEALVTGGKTYIVRFRIVEWAESILGFFRGEKK